MWVQGILDKCLTCFKGININAQMSEQILKPNNSDFRILYVYPADLGVWWEWCAEHVISTYIANSSNEC